MLAEFELGFQEPDLGEGEFFVGDEVEAGGVNGGGAVGGLVGEFFPQGVEDPKVDVAAPVAFFVGRGNVGDGFFVGVADAVGVGGGFFEAAVVEPEVDVLGGFFDLFFVLHPSAGEDDVFDAGTVAELLLEGCVGFVEDGGFGAGEAVEGIFVDSAGAFVFFQFGFEAGVGDEEAFVHEVVAEGFDGRAKDFADEVAGAVFFFESRPFDPISRKMLACVVVKRSEAVELTLALDGQW